MQIYNQYLDVIETDPFVCAYLECGGVIRHLSRGRLIPVGLPWRGAKVAMRLHGDTPFVPATPRLTTPSVSE